MFILLKLKGSGNYGKTDFWVKMVDFANRFSPFLQIPVKRYKMKKPPKTGRRGYRGGYRPMRH